MRIFVTFLTFLPIRDKRRLALNFEVTLALMDFFFTLPSALFPMITIYHHEGSSANEKCLLLAGGMDGGEEERKKEGGGEGLLFVTKRKLRCWFKALSVDWECYVGISSPDSNVVMLGNICIMRKLEVLLLLLCFTVASVSSIAKNTLIGTAGVPRTLANETMMTVATPTFSPEENT